MINPNTKHAARGTVLECRRSPYADDISIVVRLDSGTELTELGFLYHKTLKVGDRVNCTIGFRITADRFGIESVRKTRIGA